MLVLQRLSGCRWVRVLAARTFLNTQVKNKENYACYSEVPAVQRLYSECLLNNGHSKYLFQNSRTFSQASVGPEVEEDIVDNVGNAEEGVDKPPPVRAMHPNQSRDLVKKGAILEIRRDNKNVLVVVVRQEGPKTWLAADQDSKPLLVFQTQIQLVLPGSSYTHTDVKRLNEKVENADRNLIQQAWEQTKKDLENGVDVSQKQVFNLPQMTQKLFDSVTAESLYVSHRLLSEDGLYFKQVGRMPPMYEPRTADDVDMIKDFRESQQQNEKIFQKFKDTVMNAKDAPKELKPQKEDWKSWGLEQHVHDLEMFALCKSTPEMGLKVLHACGFEASPAGAAQCLHGIGYWAPHVQLPIRRLDLDKPFPEHVEEAARNVTQHPVKDPDRSIRIDLTHHRVITIDADHTTEVDDGLSVEQLQDGRNRIWIHIADPTRHVSPDDVLDTTARDRCKSVYVPTGMIPMFPLCLAEGIFSLNLECECDALSVGVIIRDDGSVDEYEIIPSTIRPTIKLSYDHADELLARDDTQEMYPDLVALNQVSKSRFKYRKDKGAVQIQMPECEPVVERIDIEDPDIQMRIVKVQPSRTLVAEMMILAGEVVGRFGTEHRIPLPYRGQLQPVYPKEIDINDLPEGFCRESAKRLISTRSIFSPSQGLRHASLGVDHYVQVSSPIRRYGDVIAHYQLKSFLSGRALPYTAPQIQQIMESVNDKTRDLLKVEGECRKYWTAEFFRQNKQAQFKGLLCRWIRHEFGLAQALIEDLGLEVVAKIHRPANIGELVTLKVADVNVAAGLFRLEEPIAEGAVGKGESKLIDEDVGMDGLLPDVIQSNNPYNY
eukprot:TRINITY_DN45660_c0_g1_i1.p1 TRINITY_DN45660_c0_g1~~TRINITY_DN45660_c0_g1_i1.p1  ORF type:complete len:829 (+),score=102.80 TRINITY_DN45660_c0_g1_i1:167-2653(+)